MLLRREGVQGRMMQSKAVSGVLKTWRPGICSRFSLLARAMTGPDRRGKSPSLSKSQAESVEKEAVGEEGGEMEVEEDTWDPSKRRIAMEDFVEGGLENTPLSPIPPRRSPSLKHTAASPPAEPTSQQKRRFASASRKVLEDASCAGLDGTPLKEDHNDKCQDDKEDDDDLLHRKPSPLSEIEFADAWFPITQAIDYEVTKDPIEEVVGFNEEQLDTAEEALRGKRFFDKARSRGGDPDFPPSKVLASTKK